MTAVAPLGTIPVLQGTPEDLLQARLDDAMVLLAEGKRQYGARALAAADRVARHWLHRTENPLLGEIDRMADVLGQPGAHMLNLSYEWGCTSAVFADQGGTGARLVRTLDWPFRHMGERLAVLRQNGSAGSYLNVTWAGFAGILTAMAPGRFSIALNQAKMLHGRWTRKIEWPIARARFLASNALPPAHLLRLVCDRAGSYAEATRLLCETPVCLPVFFILAGTRPDEHCVIERLPDRAFLREGPAICANHWQFPGVLGARPGPLIRFDERTDYVGLSKARLAGLAASLEMADFGWVAPPVLTPDTRVAVSANAATGDLCVMGFAEGGAATQALRLAG